MGLQIQGNLKQIRGKRSKREKFYDCPFFFFIFPSFHLSFYLWCVEMGNYFVEPFWKHKLFPLYFLYLLLTFQFSFFFWFVFFTFVSCRDDELFCETFTYSEPNSAWVSSLFFFYLLSHFSVSFFSVLFTFVRCRDEQLFRWTFWKINSIFFTYSEPNCFVFIKYCCHTSDWWVHSTNKLEKRKRGKINKWTMLFVRWAKEKIGVKKEETTKQKDKGKKKNGKQEQKERL